MSELRRFLVTGLYPDVLAIHSGILNQVAGGAHYEVVYPGKLRLPVYSGDGKVAHLFGTLSGQQLCHWSQHRGSGFDPARQWPTQQLP